MQPVSKNMREKKKNMKETTANLLTYASGLHNKNDTLVFQFCVKAH